MASYNMDGYRVIEGDIATGVENSLLSKGSLKNIIYISIDNDSTDNGLIIKFDSISNDEIALHGGENLTINNVSFINCYLSNRSGESIHYRILIIGDN